MTRRSRSPPARGSHAALPLWRQVVAPGPPLSSRLVEQHFCNVSLRSLEGDCFKSHRLVLSMVSDPLFAMLRGGCAAGHDSVVPVEASSEVLGAFLECICSGTAGVTKEILPELLRLVHRWDVRGLQATLTDMFWAKMTPELCASLVLGSEVLLDGVVGELLNQFALKNFVECSKTEGFGSWPLHRLMGLVSSDDLAAQNEEEVLAAVLRWHRSASGRDEATAALLNVVRFPLLSVASLRALLSSEGLTGQPGIVISRLAAAALTSHNGRSSESTCEPPPIRKRKAYPFWWADVGCSIRGGSVVAERSSAFPDRIMSFSRVLFHDGSLYILHGPHILQWPLGASSGRVVARRGLALSGGGVLADISDFTIDAAGDLSTFWTNLASR